MFLPILSISDHQASQVTQYLATLPTKYVGTLYAIIKSPLGFKKKYKVEAWGQLCDGREHKDAVHNMLYNGFPNHGKGYTYIAWEAVPDKPEVNDRARKGDVKDPKPYHGKGFKGDYEEMMAERKI